MHILFVMIKVLRVPPSNPLVWQLFLNGEPVFLIPCPASSSPPTSDACCDLPCTSSPRFLRIVIKPNRFSLP